jgi:hypothetical protein
VAYLHLHLHLRLHLHPHLHLANAPLSTASGLYYLSELVEEHTVIAKRLLAQLIYIVIGIQLVLWLVDGLPFLLTLLGVVSHVVYLGNMRRFPFVRLTDPLFLASCGTPNSP